MNLDKVKAIADALGWETEHNKVVSVISVYTSALDPFRMRTDMYSHDFIAFAACAKSETHKQKLVNRIFSEKAGVICDSPLIVCITNGGEIVTQEYDPECVISEATALIDAIYAALEMETTT